MAKDKSEKKAKKEAKTVASKPSAGNLKTPVKENAIVPSSKEILANGTAKVRTAQSSVFHLLYWFLLEGQRQSSEGR
jgi:hypothetical protein